MSKQKPRHCFECEYFDSKEIELGSSDISVYCAKWSGMVTSRHMGRCSWNERKTIIVPPPKTWKAKPAQKVEIGNGSVTLSFDAVSSEEQRKVEKMIRQLYGIKTVQAPFDFDAVARRHTELLDEVEQLRSIRKKSSDLYEKLRTRVLGIEAAGRVARDQRIISAREDAPVQSRILAELATRDLIELIFTPQIGK